MSAWRIPMANPARAVRYTEAEHAAVLWPHCPVHILALRLFMEGRVTPPPRIKLVDSRGRAMRYRPKRWRN